MRTSSRITFVAVLLLLFFQVESARASDMTGAVVYILGIGLIGCLLLGLILALILKFALKRGHWVWLLIPGLPIAAILLLSMTRFFSGDYERNYHAGPDLEYNGSHSVSVSAEFSQKNLESALEQINRPSFKEELAHYTAEPLGEYVFALDLTAPREAIRRHYVTICVRPKVEVNTPIYEGIMFLFAKAVVASDPSPCETFTYTEPPKLR